jgi:hypothetical protein
MLKLETVLPSFLKKIRLQNMLLYIIIANNFSYILSYGLYKTGLRNRFPHNYTSVLRQWLNILILHKHPLKRDIK